MIGYGMSVCTELITVNYTDNYIYYIEPRAGINLLSFSIEMKYNLYEFNEDLALSISSSPGVGLGVPISEDGLGNVRLPIYAQIDYGKLSTSSTSNRVGIGIGLGYQFETYNLFGEIDKVSFGTVAGRIGFRFFDTTELAFKIGFPKLIPQPSSDHRPDFYSYPERQAHITSYHLSLIFYLNY